MSTKLLLSLALTSLIASTHLLAQNDTDMDLGGFDTEELTNEDSNDLDGFSDEESETNSNEKVLAPKKQSIFSINGNLAFKTSYGYIPHSVKAHQVDTKPVDYSGFNQAQTSLYLQVDGKLSDDWKVRISGDTFYDALYDIRTNNDYNQDTLDDYRTQIRFDDTYIQGRLSRSIDVKVGRQIVVWGKSDSIRITDVINPIDNRLPGMTDIEDLRLSTTMAKLDYYLGQWNFSAMAIGETRTFIESAPRSEFFPVDSIFPGAPDPFITLENPEISWDNMQYAFAANGIFSGWDLSFYGADVLDSRWHIEGSLPNATREVSKIQMLGSAINIVTGSWLLKSEVAYIDGIKYNSTLDEKARVDTLVGVDYMGIKDSVLSLEIANKRIFDYETQMSGAPTGIIPYVPDYTQEDEVQTAIRATRSFENDSINTTVLLSMFGHNWQYGGFFRASVTYDVVDAVVANFGVIDYIDAAKKEDKPFMNAISNNDRVFADITYSF
ncbi:DUF1302 family protein [Sulfurimonas sp.]|jgi:hypothetical protein|uniref:DUF1302 family protein n=1 Tax=Sulfurimonas sp. TaxID=2022749 RepID=UPI0025D14344|nr:DUF1302 family protein [Sulfurimonas sp.]MBT5934593.1 DUF1302 family protein [Sulfurimonas sp.]